ncbi:MAG: recombination protein RecR, partial [Clostridia bacterium]|nr:recombination protein RecR [Clostridia bacterium]
MLYHYPQSLNNLIDELTKLPGIGPKTAQRLAFHLLNTVEKDAVGLARAIVTARQKTRRCSLCANLTEEDPCTICRDTNRETGLLCVVEQPRDLFAMEKTREFKGKYHVLHGAISPMDGIGPEQLTVSSLLSRLREGQY